MMLYPLKEIEWTIQWGSFWSCRFIRYWQEFYHRPSSMDVCFCYVFDTSVDDIPVSSLPKFPCPVLSSPCHICFKSCHLMPTAPLSATIQKHLWFAPNLESTVDPFSTPARSVLFFSFLCTGMCSSSHFISPPPPPIVFEHSSPPPPCTMCLNRHSELHRPNRHLTIWFRSEHALFEICLSKEVCGWVGGGGGCRLWLTEDCQRVVRGQFPFLSAASLCVCQRVVRGQFPFLSVASLCVCQRVVRGQFPFLSVASLCVCQRVVRGQFPFLSVASLCVCQRVVRGQFPFLSVASLCVCQRVVRGQFPFLSVASLCVCQRVVRGQFPFLSVASLCVCQRVVRGQFPFLSVASLCVCQRVVRCQLPFLSVASLCVCQRVVRGQFPFLSAASLCVCQRGCVCVCVTSLGVSFFLRGGAVIIPSLPVSFVVTTPPGWLKTVSWWGVWWTLHQFLYSL